MTTMERRRREHMRDRYVPIWNGEEALEIIDAHAMEMLEDTTTPSGAGDVPSIPSHTANTDREETT